MKFTVLWTLAAEDELAEIWLSADDRTAVTNAADEIDHRLRIDPINEGEYFASRLARRAFDDCHGRTK